MATYGQSTRRGLPRRPGGNPWPADELLAPDVQTSQVAESAAAPADTVAAPAATVSPAPASTTAVDSGVATRAARSVRRGLPRTPGGDAWPPAGASPVRETAAALTVAPAAAAATIEPAAATTQSREARHAATAAAASASGASAVPSGNGSPLRRGLPRSQGGEPWPPAGTAPARSLPVALASPEIVQDEHVAAAAATSTPVTPTPVTPTPGTQIATPAVPATAEPRVPAVPLPDPRTLRANRGLSVEPEPEPRRYGRFTAMQWAGLAFVGGGGLLFVAAMTVLAVRWFVSLDFMRDFLATYPGEYHLPETAESGFPAWVRWQHFFNTFFIVLIIRTGLQVRHDKRPPAFWTPRGKPGGKISLTLWLHQSLDVLWLVNGVVFVVLLFVTGHWLRIVPTSWEVFPNALSAVLQYVSLDWPTENGWVNYNSLQQIMYFLTVFVAAPLAAVTGVRMSGVWPKNARRLNRVYPVELARAIHFPVMLYFVLFIVIHVALVFATGALRNLNHMYAGADVVNWAGFWIFFASLVVIVLGWVVARPILISPIAKLFGKVSAR